MVWAGQTSFNSLFIYIIVTCFSWQFSQTAELEYEYCPLSVEDADRNCNLRENIYSRLVWNYYAGWLCYAYTNTARLINVYSTEKREFRCNGTTTYLLPVVNSTDEVVFFHYQDDNSMEYIRKSFKSETLFQNYLRCCKEADQCCSNEMNTTNILPSKDECPVVWDAWTCFPRTKVNTIARQPCSSQSYQSPDTVCTLESEKTCLYDGTTAVWNLQTNYIPCDVVPVYSRRHRYHIYSFYVCTAICLPAIIIFLLFEKLRITTRVILHRNLLIAIVLRNILTILSKQLVILDALKLPANSNHIMEENTVACRVLSFFEGASKNAIYACMLVDGFYLHKVIVRSFSKDPALWIIYAVVACLTFIPSFIWVTIVAVNNRNNCWMVDSNNEQWAVDSFRLLVLACNTILLLDIIRVMVLKMKHGSTSRQTKAAFRATLFLIPLFGIHIIVTAKKTVYDDTCTAEDVYDYTRYTMEALQGICVATLFCYTNTEVHKEVRNGWRKLLVQSNTRFGGLFFKGRHGSNNRRATTATYVGANTDF